MLQEMGSRGVNIRGAGSYIYNTPQPTFDSPTTPWTTMQVTWNQPKDQEHCWRDLTLTWLRKSDLEAFLATINVELHGYTVRKRLHKLGLHGRSGRKKPLLSKKNIKTQLAFARQHLGKHEGIPYCHVPCYGIQYGPKGVNIGNVGCYIYEKEGMAQTEMPSQS